MVFYATHLIWSYIAGWAMYSTNVSIYWSYAIAFIRGWLLTLILTSGIPAILVTDGFMGTLMTKMASRGQVAYAEAGNVVEQTIGAIRTVCH